MGRPVRAAIAVLGGALALGACRDHTVDLRFRPEAGATYEYRYEIEAVVTRSLEGEEPAVTELDTVLVVDQEVLDQAPEGGTRVAVELRRDGGAPRTAVVVLDRAGSLQGIEAVEGLAAETLGAGGQSLLGPAPVALPSQRLAAGDRWEVDDDARRGSGRLERFGVVDGEAVAVVRTDATDTVDDAVDAGGSAATLDGTVSATSTTSYDLVDGAIRRSVTSSTGDLAVEIAPPTGVDATPVAGTIAYELRVRVTRLD